MRIVFLLSFILFSVFVSAQDDQQNANKSQPSAGIVNAKKKSADKVATLDLYRFISLDNDTTYIDTSLTIQKEYSHNYLRKDIFGLLPFSNDGQTYNTLQFGLNAYAPLPEMGFKAKHFNFLEANQIRYNSVATPITELYFKSTVGRGQSVDSFLEFEYF